MYKDFTKLNLACGDNRIKDAWNVDIDSERNPDQVVNILLPLPFESDYFEEIYLFHTIEHIQEMAHLSVLSEIRRILKPETGKLFISYPEFHICVTNWLNNTRGDRAFWKATIYGLQRTIHDYHITLMDTTYFREFLKMVGFQVIRNMPEANHEYNTLLVCNKIEPQLTYEGLIKKELYG